MGSKLLSSLLVLAFGMAMQTNAAQSAPARDLTDLSNVRFTHAEIHLLLHSVPSEMEQTQQNHFSEICEEFVFTNLAMPSFGIINFSVKVTDQEFLPNSQRGLLRMPQRILGSSKVLGSLAVNALVTVMYTHSGEDVVDPEVFHRYLRLLINNRGTSLVNELKNDENSFFSNLSVIETRSSSIQTDLQNNVLPSSSESKATVSGGAIAALSVVSAAAVVTLIVLSAKMYARRVVSRDHVLSTMKRKNFKSPFSGEELTDILGPSFSEDNASPLDGTMKTVASSEFHYDGPDEEQGKEENDMKVPLVDESQSLATSNDMETVNLEETTFASDPHREEESMRRLENRRQSDNKATVVYNISTSTSGENPVPSSNPFDDEESEAASIEHGPSKELMALVEKVREEVNKSKTYERDRVQKISVSRTCESNPVKQESVPAGSDESPEKGSTSAFHSNSFLLKEPKEPSPTVTTVEPTFLVLQPEPKLPEPKMPQISALAQPIKPREPRAETQLQDSKPPRPTRRSSSTSTPSSILSSTKDYSLEYSSDEDGDEECPPKPWSDGSVGRDSMGRDSMDSLLEECLRSVELLHSQSSSTEQHKNHTQQEYYVHARDDSATFSSVSESDMSSL